MRVDVRIRYSNGNIKHEYVHISERVYISKWYYSSGVLKSEYRYKNGEAHREGSPSHTYYREDGSIYMKKYYINDKTHRLEGPSVICYSKEGTVEYEEFWINGKRIFDPLEFYCLAGEYERSKNEV